MAKEPERTIMERQGKAADAAMSASAWSTSGTLFAAVRRIYTWLLAFAGVMPTTGTIATTADLPSAGTNDFNATCKASINTEVDTALNTAIPASNTADSVNDILLDQVKPILPATGTIATTADLLSAGTNDLNATSKASIKTQAAAALTDYDPPTKAEMDSALASAGILVRTVAGKALAAIATSDLFTLSGAPIKLLGFVGLITTVIETKANATNIQFTPTGGAATDLCATLDITGAEAGKFFTITGTKANAMALSADAGIVVANLASPLVLGTGTIKMTCADTSTGAIIWYAVYEPMAPTAAVAAAA